MKDAWNRSQPYLELDTAALTDLIQPAFRGRRVRFAEVMTGGLANTLYKVLIDGTDQPFVLRFYTRDHVACQKDVDIFNLVHARVPVPELIYADPTAASYTIPYAIIAYVAGIPLETVLKSGNADGIGDASYAAGAVRGAMSAFTFPQAGFFGPGLTIAQPMVTNPQNFKAFIDQCLFEGNAAEHLGGDRTQRLHAFVESYAHVLDQDQVTAALVHADFNGPNLLVEQRNGMWHVAAVLDWEFAFAGSPLYDVGVMLRYAHQLPPQFAARFVAGFSDHGGRLPPAWATIAKLLDLINLLDFLMRAQHGDVMIRDVVGLIDHTIHAVSSR